MSVKVQRLRVLVNERLTAAAEEIFALFERTIVVYEEEMCRSEEENKRKQQLLDSVLKPQRRGVQIQPESRAEEGACLDQDTQVLQIQEAPQTLSLKQEEEQLQEVTHVAVKSEDEEQTDNDDEWERPVGSSAQQLETEAEGNNCNEVQKERSLFCGFNSAALLEISDVTVNKALSLRPAHKKYDCYICKKICRDNHDLQRHVVVHTGEKPFRCPVCSKCYSQKETLKTHMASHSSSKTDEGGQRKHGCSVCGKTFQLSTDLQSHMSSHTKKKPYSCSICKKSFTDQFSVRLHMPTHTGEKPFSCTVCTKSFRQKVHVISHMRTHTGEKPFGCSECNARFSRRTNLTRHLRVHTGSLKPNSAVGAVLK